MFCSKCGKEISETAKFCPFCGAEQKMAKGRVESEIIDPPPANHWQRVERDGVDWNSMQSGSWYSSSGIVKRNIAVYVILSICTCGIFELVWLAQMANDLNKVSNREHETSGGMVVFLSIITLGFYQFYWDYKAGKKLDEAYMMRGLPGKRNGVLYLILACVGLGIVTDALIQSELNKIAEMDAAR